MLGTFFGVVEIMSQDRRFRPKQTEALLSIYQSLLGPGNFQEKARLVTKELARLARVEWVAFRLPDPEGKGLRLYAEAGSELPDSPISQVLPYDIGLVGRAFQSGFPITANDYPNDANAMPEFAERGQKSVLSLPINVEGRILGVVLIASKKIGYFTDDRVRLMISIVDALGPPLEIARLREERERAEQSAVLRTEELAAMFEIASIASQPGDIDAKVAGVMQQLVKIVGGDLAVFRVLEEDRSALRLVDNAGPGRGVISPPQLLTFGDNIPSLAFRNGETIVVNDYVSDSRATSDGISSGIRCLVALPVVAGGNTLGVVSIGAVQNYYFTSEKVRLLAAIIDELATLLMSSNLAQDLQASQQEMAVVDRIARIVTSTLDIDEAYGEFAQEMGKLVSFDRAGVSIIDQSTQELNLAYMSTRIASRLQVGATILLKGTVSQHVAATKMTYVTGDLDQENRFWTLEYLKKIGIQSLIAVPLICMEEVIGTLDLSSRLPNAYGPKEQAIIERLASQIAPAINNSQLFQEVQRLALALESIGEAVGFVDRDWNYRFINKAFTNLYGYLPEELLGTAMINLIPDDESTQSLATDIRTKYRQSVWRGEAKRSKKNGEVIDVILTVTPVMSREGEILGAIGVSQDITDRKRAQAELNASEERYRVLVERARDGISYFNADGTFTSVNSELVAMLGWSKEELIGSHYSKVGTAESNTVWSERIELSLAGESIPFLFETEAQHKDGHKIPIEVTTNLIRDSEKKIIGFMAIARDITERKQAEERIRAAAHLSSIGELAAGVAHEINNPLTSVLGFSQFLLSKDLPPSISEDLQIVHDEADRAARIVNNLLSFARQDEPSKTFMDLNTLVERALEMKSYDFQVGNIQVTRNFPSNLPQTMLDATQMIQVILNLLNNAEHAMVHHHGGGSLTLRTYASAENVELEIIDSGPGIAESDMGKIFEPFFTTKAVGEGTGLGLSIAYGLIQQHNGDIWVESKLGEGAIFHVTLPVAGSQAEDPPPASNDPVEGNAKSVLVVEDEINIRNLLARYLNSRGFTVDTAENGEEAWTDLKSRSYDCVVMDLKMPGMSGQELYQAIVDYDRNLARKVVFISGDIVSRDTLEFLAGQDNPFLSKPVNLDELLRTVGESVKLGQKR